MLKKIFVMFRFLYNLSYIVQGYSGLSSNKGFLILNCIGYFVKCLYLKVSLHGRYAWGFLLTLAWTSMKVQNNFVFSD